MFLLAGIHILGYRMADPRIKVVEIPSLVIVKTVAGLVWVWSSRFVRSRVLRISIATAFLLFTGLVESEINAIAGIYKATPIDEQMQADMAEVADRAGFDLTRIYIADSKNKSMYYTRSVFTEVVVVSTTMVTAYTRRREKDIVEALLSHELGHRHHHDLAIEAVLEAGCYLSTSILAEYMRANSSLFVAFGFTDEPAIVAWSFAEFAVSLLRGITQPVEQWVWRLQEYAADRYAALGGHAPALCRFLTSHVRGEEKRTWLYKVLYGTHPSIHSRLERLRPFIST